LIIRILKYLRGYVIIRITGFSPERFLNLCSNHQILIWDLKNIGNAYEMCISIKSYKRLKSILKKTKTKSAILEKRGLPFFLHKYRKRKIFFLGILICAALIFLLSSFVWNIHIDGNYSRTTDVILEYLSEEGISHGIRKNKVDCNEIVRKLREKYDNIIWVSAKIQGTRLIIHVQENTDTVLEEKQEYEPSDLIADKTGIITSIITRAGTPHVNVGDTVEKGDMLVQGMLEIKDDSGAVASREYCASDADIYAQTVYQYKDEFPMEYPRRFIRIRVKRIIILSC
jgi:similar to stage IV sporulation protein